VSGGAPPIREGHIVVQRTARYLAIGEPGGQVRELWFALHGYGQLAAGFARAMAPAARTDRLIVVPEALSRFYLESPVRGAHATARVGATWMTREDREAEIADHVAYLDALHDATLATLPPVRILVLGFSQGVATATRWLTHGRARADRLVLWAGGLPDDVDVARLVDPARDTRVTFVRGREDDVVPLETIARTATRLATLGERCERLEFDGGHRLNREILAGLALGHE
jgi:predicted esterase